MSFPTINEAQVRQTARFQELSDDQAEAELDEMKSAILGQKLQEIAATQKVDLYDAIMIDESQDFHTSWLKSLVLFLKGESNFLLLAEDPLQKIYPRNSTYAEAGLKLIGGGKYFNLPLSYRSTKAIVSVASKIVQESKWDDFYKKFIEVENEYGKEVEATRKGHFPEIIIDNNYENLCDFIVGDVIKKLQEGYAYQDFGILYLTKTRSSARGRKQPRLFDRDIDYVGSIQARLAAGSVPNYWLTQNRDTRAHYDQHRDAVTISTIFSAKGLEFEVVYIVGLELFPWPFRNPRENTSMLYVAITRAKESVYLLSTEETEDVNKIRKIIDEVKIKLNN